MEQVVKDVSITGVENIVLLHLSSHNSDEQKFVDEVTAATGKLVCAAKPGLEIEMAKL